MVLNAFVIGSSLPVFVITFIYTGAAFRASERPSDVPFEQIALGVPLLFGLMGIVNWYVIKHYGNYSSFIVGAIHGLILSLLGRFILHLPSKIFDIQSNKWQVHIIAPILYGLIFLFILTPLQKHLHCGS